MPLTLCGPSWLVFAFCLFDFNTCLENVCFYFQVPCFEQSARCLRLFFILFEVFFESDLFYLPVLPSNNSYARVFSVLWCSFLINEATFENRVRSLLRRNGLPPDSHCFDEKN